MSVFGSHAFGSHAFGAHVFGHSTVPVISAGPIRILAPQQFGPEFGVQPDPVGFPDASNVDGFGEVPSLTELFKQVTGPALSQLEAQVRNAAAEGATEAVEPHLRRAYMIAGGALVLSGIALVVAMSKK